MRILVCGTIAAVLLFTQSVAVAEEIPLKLQEAWRTFSEGVAAKDIEKVVSVSRFPIVSNDYGGDIKSKKALMSKFSVIFNQSHRDCVAKGNLEPERKPGDWAVNCGGVAFGFSRAKNGEYGFAYIDNINE